MLKVALLSLVVGWTDSSSISTAPNVSPITSVVFAGKDANDRCEAEQKALHVGSTYNEESWLVSTLTYKKYTYVTTKTKCVVIEG